MLNNCFLLICEPRLNNDRFLHKIVIDPTQQKVGNMPMSLLLAFDLFIPLSLIHICLKLRKHLILPSNFALNLRYQLRLMNLVDLAVLVPLDLLRLLDLRLDLFLEGPLVLREAQTQCFPQLRDALLYF